MALAHARIIVFFVSSLLAVAVLVLAACSGDAAFGYVPSIPHFSSLTAMMIIGLFRDSVWTSYLVFEFTWLTILWILWLIGGIPIVLDFHSSAWYVLNLKTFQAIGVLSFFIWAMLFGYTITLLTFAIKAAKAGQKVWVTDVRRVRWINGPTHFEKLDTLPHGTPRPTPTTTYPPPTAKPVTPHPQAEGPSHAWRTAQAKDFKDTLMFSSMAASSSLIVASARILLVVSVAAFLRKA